MTLKEIIGQFLGSAEQSSHQFVRLWNIAVFGVKTEFNLDIVGVYRTKVLDVEPNKTVKLPCDYITYSKLGLINGEGEISTFKRNNQLSTFDSGKTNRLSGTPKGGSSVSNLNYNHVNQYNNFFDNNVMYNLFGANSGTANIGEYKVDEKAKTIFLNPNSTHDKIVLEYLCDGCDDELGILMEIDIRAAAAMLAYIRWQDAIDSRKKFSQSQVDGLKREYYRNKRLARMRLKPFRLNEMQSAIRESVKLVAKA